MKERASDVLEMVGAAVIVGGVWMIYPPAAVALLGIVIVCAAAALKK